MRLQTLLYFYGRRLRTHPIQELLAGLGIAVGVALAFAVMVANSTVVSSAEETMRGVTGSADLQLAARSAQGFDAELLAKVRRLPGVARAAPLLEQRATLAGVGGRDAQITLVSVDASLAALSGGLTRGFAAGDRRQRRAARGGLTLPSEVAAALRVEGPATAGRARSRSRVAVNVAGRVLRIDVAAVLGADRIGSLAGAKVAVLPLARLQRIAGLRGRVTRVLVDAEPGREPAVRRGLAGLAAGRLTVASVDAEQRLLEQATAPTRQVTGFFATVSALLGFLLAFNAMLLTAPERRRLVGALRIQGYRPAQIALLVLFQAVLLGIAASILGLVVGGALARGLFSESPDYLAGGFVLGTQTIVGYVPVVLSAAGGIAASCLAAAPPLAGLRRGRAVDAVFAERGSPGRAMGARARRRALTVALALLAGTAVVLAWAPAAVLGAVVMLAAGALLAVPTTFSLAVRVAERLIATVPRASALTVALLGLRATPSRSLALAATGAVAVFGSVAIGGSREDLLRGIGQNVADYVSTADLWISNPADSQGTKDIRSAGLVRRIESVPGVAAVRRYQGGFLDVGGRRAWVLARSPDDRAMLPASQMVRGNLDDATRKLRGRGWVAVSDKIARDHGVGPGERITLPTPSGDVGFRVAATTTNLGWAPGAVILNRLDYGRAWSSSTPTALGVDLERDAPSDATRLAVERAAGRAGVSVQTADARADESDALARQGLERLGQISLLLLVAAVLAMAAAMGAAVWQRRAGLAALRIQSFSSRQLWVVLLLEASIVLGAGGLTGALGGIYGQFAADRFLEVVTGFPVAAAPAARQMAETFALVVLATLAIVAVPAWLAARVPPRLGLGSQ